MYAQGAGSIENIGVDDEVVVGHVEFARHVFEEAADLCGEVNDVSGTEGAECCEALVVAAQKVNEMMKIGIEMKGNKMLINKQMYAQ